MADSFLVGVKLSEDIERGAVGGPGFNTSVLSLMSGNEIRNADWEDPRAVYDVGYGLMKKFDDGSPELTTVLEDLISFFYIVQGKTFSFRFKDFSDFEIALRNGADDGDPSIIGLGDDVKTIFQAVKRYTVAGFTFDRKITKLVSGTVQVFIDAADVTGTSTIDLDRGLITLISAPASTGGTPGPEEQVKIRAEYDVHVRLDTDELSINMAIFDAGSWPSVPLIELRETGLVAP